MVASAVTLMQQKRTENDSCNLASDCISFNVAD
jgi:hypothetical protein